VQNVILLLQLYKYISVTFHLYFTRWCRDIYRVVKYLIIIIIILANYLHSAPKKKNLEIGQ